MHKHAEAAISNSTASFEDGRWGPNEQSLKAPAKKLGTIFNGMLSSRHLSPQEKEKNRIAQDGFVVVVAGGETTGRVLTMATYHILANKEKVLPRLKEELESVMADPYTRVDVSVLEKLPWLVCVPISSIITCAVCANFSEDRDSQRVTSDHGFSNFSPATRVSKRCVGI